MALLSAKKAEEIRLLTMAVESKERLIAYLEKQLALIYDGEKSGSVRETDLQIYKERKERTKLKRKLEKKTARASISPKLESVIESARVLNNNPPAQRRFWTYGRKDMY